MVKSRKVEPAVGVGRMKRVSLGTRASVVEFRAEGIAWKGITGREEGERSRTGSATAAIFHGADVRFRSTITTKYKQKWQTRGEDEGGTSRRSGRYGTKEENGKDGNQVLRDREGHDAEKGRPA